MSRACTGWTQTGEEQLFELVSAPRESPRRQPRPNGQVPPACRGPHVPCRPRRRIRPPHTKAPRLASQRGRPRDRRGLLMHRDPSQPIPTPEPMRACRASLHMSGARPWPTGWPHKAPRASVAKRAARNISAHHGQGCDAADTAGQPARSSLPERPPPADTEEPAPRGGLGMRAQRADASSYMPYFAAAWRRATLALMHSTTPTARTPAIAVTQAADESKGVSQPYPYLRPGPLRIHKAVLIRPRFHSPAQCQARFPVIQHRNRLIPQALAAAIAPFVHWDIRAQTAGIYLPIH